MIPDFSRNSPLLQVGITGKILSLSVFFALQALYKKCHMVFPRL